jgi:MoaA/NifB/PqqE/SkfB family radical SAM enzyme
VTELHEPKAFAPLCTAPYLVMDFDPAGNVQACCVNAMYPLGNVTRSSIREIWEGERARKLRRAIERDDLGYGCGVCRHRLEFDAGDPASWYYNNYPAPEPDPEWPWLMVFALHNTCNAACIMCGGDLSSKIRTSREGREPLAHAYGDRFFEELEEFLPHLGIAEFRGGEPFLMPEHFRIWDALLRLDHRIPCNITTNGTILTDRVQALMDEMPFSFVVSIDGSTRETLESIRVGVSWDKLTTNIPRFLDYTRERGTFFHLSTCALQQNWQELPDIFRIASYLGVPLAVQPVLDQRFGLHRLPTPELIEVARALEQATAELSTSLDPGNLGVWNDFIAWLDQELRQRDQGEPLRIFEFPDPQNVAHLSATRRRAQLPGSALPTLAPTPEPAPSAPVSVAPPTRRPRSWLDRLRRGRAGVAAEPTPAPGPAAPSVSPRAQLVADRTDELAAWAPSGRVGRIRTGADDRVVEAVLDPLADVGGAGLDLGGLTFSEAVEQIGGLLGAHVWIAEEADHDGRVDHTLFFTATEHRDKTGTVVRLVSGADDEGGVTTVFALDEVMAEAPLAARA